MKKLLSIIVAVVIAACGNDSKDDPTPTPVPPEYGTTLTVFSAPDSVKVETSAELKFTVAQENHPEDFSVKVGTVMPSYYRSMTLAFGTTTGIAGGGYFWKGEDKREGKADILINGKNASDLTTIQSGKENILSFSNPTAVGEYTIILNVKDKYGRTEKKEIILKVWSPEIIIKFYTKNIGFDEDTYFEDLNKKFTYAPLSKELSGLRCDTIYTQEEPKHGYPGEWTVPGQCLICYIGQEGNNEIQSIMASSSFLIDQGKILSSTTWASRLDNKEGGFQPRKGFHGIMFETSTLTDVGSQLYTIRIVDKWGKEKMATIVYKAFGRNDAIPEHCTPSEEINFWWSHRIPD